MTIDLPTVPPAEKDIYKIVAVLRQIVELLNTSGVEALATGTREKLSAARIYYIRTNGSDSNNGLADTATGAFLTIQHAWNVIATLDLNGFYVQVRIADGTYTAGLDALSGPLGQENAAQIAFIGNTTTPANVIVTVSAAAASCFRAGNDLGGIARFHVEGMELRTTGSGWDCISALNAGSIITFNNIRFGTCARFHLDGHHSSYIKALGNYEVTGGAQCHAFSVSNCVMVIYTVTIVYSNSPNFSLVNFIAAGGQLYCAGMTFTNGGTVTGIRYFASENGLIDTGEGGPDYVPGDAPGDAVFGGIYL